MSYDTSEFLEAYKGGERKFDDVNFDEPLRATVISGVKIDRLSGTLTRCYIKNSSISSTGYGTMRHCTLRNVRMNNPDNRYIMDFNQCHFNRVYFDDATHNAGFERCSFYACDVSRTIFHGDLHYNTYDELAGTDSVDIKGANAVGSVENLVSLRNPRVNTTAHEHISYILYSAARTVEQLALALTVANCQYCWTNLYSLARKLDVVEWARQVLKRYPELLETGQNTERQILASEGRLGSVTQINAEPIVVEEDDDDDEDDDLDFDDEDDDDDDDD